MYVVRYLVLLYCHQSRYLCYPGPTEAKTIMASPVQAQLVGKKHTVVFEEIDMDDWIEGTWHHVTLDEDNTAVVEQQYDSGSYSSNTKYSGTWTYVSDDEGKGPYVKVHATSKKGGGRDLKCLEDDKVDDGACDETLRYKVVDATLVKPDA